MEGETSESFCLLLSLPLPSRLSLVSGSKLYCDVVLLVRSVSYRQKCELGKGWRKKRQPICIIWRRPSVRWWEEEGNPVFTFKRIVPPSSEIQPWKTPISVWVGWGLISVSEHLLVAMPYSWPHFPLCTGASFAFQLERKLSSASPLATKDSVVSPIPMFKPICPLSYRSGLSSSKMPLLTTLLSAMDPWPS